MISLTMKKKKKTTTTNQTHKPTKPISQIIFLILLSLLSCVNSLRVKPPPPLPILPLPSARQLQWQLGNMALFLHFGPNTFTDSEWGTGDADPSVFNPTNFDPTQWVRVAKDSGFSRVILTTKHHDGFCLWPSEYTDYSVKSSPWRNGSGDVVAELANAARDAGIGLGLYLSPWDRHDVSYGKTLEYNEFYMGQMTELLTGYGEIKEVWLDGAKGEGEKDMEYFFDSWFSLIHQLQPGAVIFSDAGPDTRWIGDEAGVAESTCWSLFNRSDAQIGGTDPQYSRGGDPVGHDWVPAECDVSIRPGWFWHASEAPKSARNLLDIYYKSIELLSFNVLQVQEPIHMGQRVIEFHLEILNKNGKWKNVINGTTVGYQRLLQFPTVKSQYLRFVINKSRADPLISYFGIYMDQGSIVSNNISDTSSRTHFNSSQILRQMTYNHSQIDSL
ncbi:alpha-l-fucosidase 1 [Quercus suber]|uniref:alpha-L-fucosidase n=1 Tax=Quercus suber TaxID=58331 RepID=A0AAW0KFF2_QUESU